MNPDYVAMSKVVADFYSPDRKKKGTSSEKDKFLPFVKEAQIRIKNMDGILSHANILNVSWTLYQKSIKEIDTSAYEEEAEGPKEYETQKGVMYVQYVRFNAPKCATTGKKIQPGEKFLFHGGLFYSTSAKIYHELAPKAKLFDWG